MKKRTFSFLLALVMCLSLLPMTALAAEMPTTIEAPSSIVLSETVLGVPCLQVTFNKGADLSEMISYGTGTAGREQYGVETIGYFMQIDWSLDSQNDWKYHENWDTRTTQQASYDALGEYVNEAIYANTTENTDILRIGSGSWEDWLLYIDEGQYSENANGVKYIDYQEHTVYVRARFGIAYRPTGGKNTFLFSDWSPVAAYGKDRKPFERPTSLEAPVISDLQLTETFEGDPVATFHLTNPQSVKDNAVGAQSIGDELYLHAEVSIGGGAWTSVQLQDRDISDGQINAFLTTAADVVTDDTYIKLRVRYEYHDGSGALLLASDWSNVIEFGAPAWGNASDWATEELARADELGLIPDCLVGADMTKSITRAEFAAVSVKVYEALTGETAIAASENPFTDTTDAEVLKAYNTGITAGTGDGTTFSPDAILNREQAATMLTRVYKKTAFDGWSLSTDGNFALTYDKPAAFADDANISDWAKDSVYFMAANGIIKGVGDGTKFAPKNTTTAEESIGYANATREQALLIAVRMVENLQ